MSCKHGRLRTVGDRVFCCECGEELPLEVLTGEQKQAENQPADGKTDKPTPKKRAAKKAE